MIRLLISLLLMFQVCFASDITLEEAKSTGMWETLRNYIHHNSVIVDICVYEQEWIPPSEFSLKGELIQRATITHVHCGSLKIGQRIEYVHYIEEAPRFFGRFRSTVPGELRTFFYDPDGLEAQEDRMLKIKGDGHWGFRRVGDVFAELFALELKSNPKLTTKREQGDATQPATRSESKSDGNKKPKPKVEGRSR